MNTETNGGASSDSEEILWASSSPENRTLTADVINGDGDVSYVPRDEIVNTKRVDTPSSADISASFDRAVQNLGLGGYAEEEEKYGSTESHVEAFRRKYTEDLDRAAEQTNYYVAGQKIIGDHSEEYQKAVEADREQQRNSEKAPEKQTIAELAFTKIDAAVDESSFLSAGDETTKKLVKSFRSAFAVPEAAEGSSGDGEINRDEDLTYQIINNLTIQEIEAFSSGRDVLRRIIRDIGRHIVLGGKKISDVGDSPDAVDKIIVERTESLRKYVQKQCSKLKFILDKNKDKITLPVQAAGTAAIEGAVIEDTIPLDEEDPFDEYEATDGQLF